MSALDWSGGDGWGFDDTAGGEGAELEGEVDVWGEQGPTNWDHEEVSDALMSPVALSRLDRPPAPNADELEAREQTRPHGNVNRLDPPA